MDIQPIEHILDGVSLVPLRCLRPDRQPYAAMLLQPDGPIEGSNKRIGHHNQKRGNDLCRLFLHKCIEVHADLAVTPEYCLPWGIVKEIGSAGSQLHPPQGGIWALGCESIGVRELTQVVSDLRQLGHLVHHEQLDPAEAAQKAYVNPLVYVFWCSQQDGSNVLFFCIQFKTTPSRDCFDVEQRSLCVGKLVYIFNRGINKISLLTLVCSDAFAFTEAMVQEFHSNLLLIHIQLNPKPTHKDFARYRTKLISIASNRDVNLLCLNWAGNIAERLPNGKDKFWNNNSVSAIYVPPSKFVIQELVVVEAHRRGLYYSMVYPWHGFYLNQEPHAVMLQMQKVMMHGDPLSTATSTSTTVVQRWIWAPDVTDLIPKTEADDGFEQALASYPNLRDQLKTLSAASPIAVERTLEMLVAAPKKSDCWYEIGALQCMRVTECETLKRITVHQDLDPDSPGVAYRKQRLEKAQAAATLPRNGVPWPPPLMDLEEGFVYSWAPGEPYQNIRATKTGMGAGLVFLGDQSGDDDIHKAASMFLEGTMAHASKKAFQERTDVIEAQIRSRDRFCVVYRRNNELKTYCVGDTSRIDRPLDQSQFDIAGEGA